MVPQREGTRLGGYPYVPSWFTVTLCRSPEMWTDGQVLSFLSRPSEAYHYRAHTFLDTNYPEKPESNNSTVMCTTFRQMKWQPPRGIVYVRARQLIPLTTQPETTTGLKSTTLTRLHRSVFHLPGMGAERPRIPATSIWGRSERVGTSTCPVGYLERGLSVGGS